MTTIDDLSITIGREQDIPIDASSHDVASNLEHDPHMYDVIVHLVSIKDLKQLLIDRCKELNKILDGLTWNYSHVAKKEELMRIGNLKEEDLQ